MHPSSGEVGINQFLGRRIGNKSISWDENCISPPEKYISRPQKWESMNFLGQDMSTLLGLK